MTPQRIQLSRTKGWRMPENTVKVSRPGKWGNPFKATDQYIAGPAGEKQGLKPGDAIGAAGAVVAYRNALEKLFKTSPASRLQLLELRGKNLACWCKIGAPCHADVLLELASKYRDPVASEIGKAL